MTDIQKYLLDLLLEIDEICKENGIEYYLDGGTALGAVRHRGFLPWDDDGDIMFTRDNWLKFLKAVRENPRPNRVIEGLDNCPDYTMVYARYCATDTTCILRTSMIDQFRSGLFIDLFVLDPIPDTPQWRKEYFEILHGYAEYLNPYYYDTVVGNNSWYEAFRDLGAKQGRQAVTDLVQQKLFCFPDEPGMTYGFRYDNGHFIYPRDVVGRPVYVPFENTRLPVAERVEDYLRIHYGDSWYMIPPMGLEETHNVVIDLDVSYDQFRDSYMPMIDRPLAKKHYEKLHDLRMEQRRATDQIDKANYTVSAQLLGRLINARFARTGTSGKQLLEQQRCEDVRRCLGSYFDTQLNRWFVYHRVFVPLTDENLYAALYLLVMDGQLIRADRILALRREQGTPLSEALVQIGVLIGQIRDVIHAYEWGNMEKTVELSAQLLRGHSRIRPLQEYYLRARAVLAQTGKDAAQAAAVVAQIDALDWASDRLRGTRLILLLHFGDRSQRSNAMEQLPKLRKATADGILRLEIKDALIAAAKDEDKDVE